MSALTTYLASAECREEVKGVSDAITKVWFGGTTVPFVDYAHVLAALNAVCEQLREQADASLSVITGLHERIRELEAENARLKTVQCVITACAAHPSRFAEQEAKP